MHSAWSSMATNEAKSLSATIIWLKKAKILSTILDSFYSLSFCYNALWDCPLPECWIEGNVFPSCLWSLFFLYLSGDAYFFKNNSYWVVKSGELDQDSVARRSTAVDWMRCPEPTPTTLPGNPRGGGGDCNCGISGALQMSASSWLLLIAVLLYPAVFI